MASETPDLQSVNYLPGLRWYVQVLYQYCTEDRKEVHIFRMD